MENDATLLRENLRLRKENAHILSELETMELRARVGEKAAVMLSKKLKKILDMLRGDEAIENA